VGLTFKNFTVMLLGFIETITRVPHTSFIQANKNAIAGLLRILP
jgi:hypothetical protein